MTLENEIRSSLELLEDHPNEHGIESNYGRNVQEEY